MELDMVWMRKKIKGESENLNQDCGIVLEIESWK